MKYKITETCIKKMNRVAHSASNNSPDTKLMGSGGICQKQAQSTDPTPQLTGLLNDLLPTFQRQKLLLTSTDGFCEERGLPLLI